MNAEQSYLDRIADAIESNFDNWEPDVTRETTENGTAATRVAIDVQDFSENEIRGLDAMVSEFAQNHGLGVQTPVETFDQRVYVLMLAPTIAATVNHDDLL